MVYAVGGFIGTRRVWSCMGVVLTTEAKQGTFAKLQEQYPLPGYRFENQSYSFMAVKSKCSFSVLSWSHELLVFLTPDGWAVTAGRGRGVLKRQSIHHQAPTTSEGQSQDEVQLLLARLCLVCLWVLRTLQSAGKEPSPGVREGLLSFLLCMYLNTVLGMVAQEPACN